MYLSKLIAAMMIVASLTACAPAVVGTLQKSISPTIATTSAGQNIVGEWYLPSRPGPTFKLVHLCNGKLESSVRGLSPALVVCVGENTLELQDRGATFKVLASATVRTTDAAPTLLMDPQLVDTKSLIYWQTSLNNQTVFIYDNILASVVQLKNVPMNFNSIIWNSSATRALITIGCDETYCVPQPLIVYDSVQDSSFPITALPSGTSVAMKDKQSGDFLSLWRDLGWESDNTIKATFVETGAGASERVVTYNTDTLFTAKQYTYTNSNIGIAVKLPNTWGIMTAQNLPADQGTCDGCIYLISQSDDRRRLLIQPIPEEDYKAYTLAHSDLSEREYDEYQAYAEDTGQVLKANGKIIDLISTASCSHAMGSHFGLCDFENFRLNTPETEDFLAQLQSEAEQIENAASIMLFN